MNIRKSPIKHILRTISLIFLAIFSVNNSLNAQPKVQIAKGATSFPVEGFFFEDNNRGYLAEVKVTLLNEQGIKVDEVFSDEAGKFIATLEPNHIYKMRAEKRAFYVVDTIINTNGHQPSEPLYLKYPLKRLPGYIFDATISQLLTQAEKDAGTYAFAIDTVKVEIYNTTKKREEMVYNTKNTNLFNFVFEQGNHYSILLRKKGYFNKRIEANINIHGCILCFEGLGSINPGVVDNLTEKNTAGTLGANIQMKRIEMGKAVKIENIYYDLAKSTLRPEAIKELDKMANVLRDNPALLIELGSHTDARGGADENMQLSERRAQAAVDYIVSKGVNKTRIVAKGYGETKLVNGCSDGMQCTEEMHQLNRRTEFRVTGIAEFDPYEAKSLKEIIEEQEFMDKIMKGDIEQYNGDGTPPSASPSKTQIPDNQADKSVDNHVNPPVEHSNSGASTDQPQRSSMSQADIDKANEEARKAAILAALGGEAPAAETPPNVISAPVIAIDSMSVPNMDAPTNPLPTDVTGYKIQLLDEPEPITLSNPLFKAFKSVYAEVPEEKHYTYLIGDYKSSVSAQAFLKKIHKQYPDAKIIHYVDGKRVTE